jgi:BNR/Asp-box repeat
VLRQRGVAMCYVLYEILAMPAVHHLDPAAGTLVLVGTMKGAFFVSGRDVAGPYFAGQAVYAMAYDGRRRRLYAATHSAHWGAVVSLSDDLGRTWTNPERAPIRFPEGSGASLAQIWQIVVADDAVYAGVDPAALFVSRDAGETWSLVAGLWNHPQRPQWQPGGGGLCLHTIIVQGRRILCAASSVGVYRTDDGGESWQARNAGIRAGYLPPGQQYPEFGQCVHKLAADPTEPRRLYLQHHGGVYRSDDGGDSWHDIGAGLPSDFGFALAVHPRDGGTAFIVPLESDQFRATPEARLRVFRTRDGGASWAALDEGLPQSGAYETVLRDGLAVSAADPAGVYFGTRSGKLYASDDEGDHWRLARDGLPPIVCVKTAQLV